MKKEDLVHSIQLNGSLNTGEDFKSFGELTQPLRPPMRRRTWAPKRRSCTGSLSMEKFEKIYNGHLNTLFPDCSICTPKQLNLIFSFEEVARHYPDCHHDFDESGPVAHQAKRPTPFELQCFVVEPVLSLLWIKRQTRKEIRFLDQTWHSAGQSFEETPLY